MVRLPALAMRRFQTVLLIALACLLSDAARADCPLADNGHCVARALPGGGSVVFPRLRWNTIARVGRTPSGDGFDLRYLKGGRTQVTRHSAAAALGLAGRLVSGVFYQPPGSAPIVFARFAPGSNALRIDILRIEREPDGGVKVADALFGPHHGDVFLATQDFISAADRNAGQPGRNPLAAWSAPEDDVFHNICFQCPTASGALDPYTSGVAVALGVAMRHVGAQIGILAVAREWIDVQESSSGGLLWSTVTVKVSGYARPDWWIASPIGAQVGGTSTLGICAASESPCQPEHLVRAGIQLAPWSGPNLPTDQDRLYYSENSQSGFTVLGYSLITAVLVGTGSYLWGGELLSGGGIADATATTEITGAASFGTAGLDAIAGGAGYLGLTNVIHPGSSGDLQKGYLGPGYQPDSTASVSSDSASRTLVTKSRELQIGASLSAGLAGVRRLYAGGCNNRLPRRECQGSPSGVVPRSDDKAAISVILEAAH